MHLNVFSDVSYILKEICLRHVASTLDLKYQKQNSVVRTSVYTILSDEDVAILSDLIFRRRKKILENIESIHKEKLILIAVYLLIVLVKKKRKIQ